MITIIISSWKEPRTVGKTIESLVNTEYSGLEGQFEVIQVSPDEETLNAGAEAAKRLKLNSPSQYRQLVDECKGKPVALNMAFGEAKGDIIIMADGDTYFDKMAVKLLISPLLNDPKIGGVSGQPVSSDPKTNMMGYWGHLLTAAADHKRRHDKEFPLSGYIMAFRDLHQGMDPTTRVDDAYISYQLLNAGYRLEYVPEARVFVSFPKTLKDYFKQKTRSLGGFVPLNKNKVVKTHKKQRTFLEELSYAFFPIQYSRSLRELIWSIALYPARLWTWWLIFLKNRKEKREIKGWERIESTK